MNESECAVYSVGLDLGIGNLLPCALSTGIFEQVKVPSPRHQSILNYTRSLLVYFMCLAETNANDKPLHLWEICLSLLTPSDQSMERVCERYIYQHCSSKKIVFCRWQARLAKNG